MKKQDQYATKLIAAITDVLQNDDNENHIDMGEFAEDDNATDFFHALGNLMPSYFYRMFSGENGNLIQFNHIANQLIFQNAIEDERAEAKKDKNAQP